MNAGHELAERIRGGLRASAQPDKAEPMRAYLTSDLPRRWCDLVAAAVVNAARHTTRPGRSRASCESG